MQFPFQVRGEGLGWGGEWGLRMVEVGTLQPPQTCKMARYNTQGTGIMGITDKIHGVKTKKKGRGRRGRQPKGRFGVCVRGGRER